MRRLLLVLLFTIGLVWAVATYSGGLANRGEYDSLILDFSESTAASPADLDSQIEALAQQFNLELSLNSEFSEADHVYIVKGDAALLNRLRESDLATWTEFIEPNYTYSTTFRPNDPDFQKQWNLRSINMEEAWGQSSGKGATVAVIDTGVTRGPDLRQTAFVPGYDFVNDRPEATDDNGHGTHVAGTIAQSTHNGYGVAGIAYQAKIMPLKVLGRSGGGTVADIAEAVRFAADQGADVINMSLGGGGASQLFQEAIDYAHSKGVVVVAAAGNENRNAASYPARYDHVIAVSAFDAESQKAPYSNYGAGVDIAAPGGSTQQGEAGGILQETIDPQGRFGFRYLQGTSMAAPHVAGVAASLKAMGMTNPDQVEQILLRSARSIADDSRNYFGAGQLDAAKALKAAASQSPQRLALIPLAGEAFWGDRLWLDFDLLRRYDKLVTLMATLGLAIVLGIPYRFTWKGWFWGGLLLGSVGLFVFKDLYVLDLPQWPLRLLGSSLVELGDVFQATGRLNPIFASVLIPLGLVVGLLSLPQGKWFAIGSTIGVAAALGVSAIVTPHLLWLGSGWVARTYLLCNACLCLGLAHLSLQAAVDSKTGV